MFLLRRVKLKSVLNIFEKKYIPVCASNQPFLSPDVYYLIWTRVGIPIDDQALILRIKAVSYLKGLK